MTYKKTLLSSSIDTKLGDMIVISDDTSILLMEFCDRPRLEREIQALTHQYDANLIQGQSEPGRSIARELDLYFEGKLKRFETPLSLTGTVFQKQVWQALLNIPYGETRSYLDIAKAIGKPSACRAVARANASNIIPIIIPCHRVINHNGNLGGYSGGLLRKKSLLKVEGVV